MVYRAIGLMSGSSLDGLDIAFIEFQENRGKWNFEIKNTKCVPYTADWQIRLTNAANITAAEYVQLDNDYGRFLGEQIRQFVSENDLFHKIQIIGSHGHTVFHAPQHYLTAQIGNGAQIAAITSTNVIDNLRILDVALGGQGAPIVPMGEKHLFSDYAYFLNLGGIANISIHEKENIQAFDICVANQALNYFAQKQGKNYDENGLLATRGKISTALLSQLNALPYCQQQAPKSLSNQYFKDTILPLITSFNLNDFDVLRTFTEHIVSQITYCLSNYAHRQMTEEIQLFITGGGAFNEFLIERLRQALLQYNIKIQVPEKNIIDYKEALIMAFLGLLRWREENTTLPITGASRPSIGGAVWIGQEY